MFYFTRIRGRPLAITHSVAIKLIKVIYTRVYTHLDTYNSAYHLNMNSNHPKLTRSVAHTEILITRLYTISPWLSVLLVSNQNLATELQSSEAMFKLFRDLIARRV